MYFKDHIPFSSSIFDDLLYSVLSVEDFCEDFMSYIPSSLLCSLLAGPVLIPATQEGLY